VKNLITKVELKNLRKKLNETAVSLDVIQLDQDSAIQILNLLNDGSIKPKITPKFSEPDMYEDEGGNMKDEIILDFENSSLSLFFKVDWSYEVKKGQRSPNPNLIPDDPDELILNYMSVEEFIMYLNDDDYTVEVNKEVNTLAIKYFKNFINADEINL
jgi:hypothetical protein